MFRTFQRTDPLEEERQAKPKRAEETSAASAGAIESPSRQIRSVALLCSYLFFDKIAIKSGQKFGPF